MASKKNGIGHNSSSEPLTDDEKADLVAFHGLKIRKEQLLVDAANAELKARKADLKLLFKSCEGDLGFNRGEFEDILAKQDMTPAEFRFEENKRLDRLRLAGLPVGAQLTLPLGDTADELGDAYLIGKQAGLAGADPTPPSHIAAVAVTEWQRGWSEGQAEIGERMIRAEAIREARKPKTVEPQPEPEPSDDDGDPEVIRAKARKLKNSSFMDRSPADEAPVAVN